MTADIDLPVWSIGPNWKDGILERLEWLSDVISSTYGTEQRRALRLSPRRSFDVTFLPLDQERGFFDLWLHRLGSNECMVPLWHDRGTLTAPINAGAAVISLDTTFREFVEGGLAIIVGPDPFTFDKVSITAITDTQITVAPGDVTRNWPAGSVIHPLRRARLDEESVAAALTSRVGQATIRFDLNQANDIADEGTWADIYGTYPIILKEPNRREQLELRFQRNRIVVDNEQGLRELADDAGRAFTLQTHQMLLDGREEQWAFRQMLYRLRGQQTSVWLPTFNRDIELSRDAVAAASQIDVKQIGYAYTGGSAIGGRQHILINGSIAREITGLGAAPSGTEERLLLDSALGVDVPAGSYVSFMDTCRLGQDTIEIHHHTDTEGVAEAGLSFRAFRDERTEPATLSFPIAASAQDAANCGAPAVEEGDCFAAAESGFWAEMNFDWTYDDPLLPTGAAGINLSFYDASDNLLGNASTFSHPAAWTRTVDDSGHTLGQRLRLITNIWPVDPFAGQPGGRPARITAEIQFGAFQVPLRPGGLHTRGQANFRLPDDVPVTIIPTPADAEAPMLFQIYSLWPINLTFTF